MKQTAVEWLYLMMNNPNSNQEFNNKLFEKAKEIEKEQIINTFYDCKLSIIDRNPIDAEQYFNKTFKKLK